MSRKDSPLPSPTDIVRSALDSVGGKQSELAKLLGCTQPTISKYRNGQLDLPGETLIKCLQISGLWEPDSVTAEHLIKRIKEEFSGVRHENTRRTINHLLNSLTTRSDKYS